MKQNKKDFSNISVFIFGAGGRQCLPVCRGFFELGCKVIAYTPSKLSTGYLTKYVSERVLNTNEDTFYSQAVELIKNNRYSLVVPLGDKVAQFLSDHKKELEQYSKIAVNAPEVFIYAKDKALTMEVCRRNNIPAPRTFFDKELDPDIIANEIAFPVVVKPRVGLGSIGFNIIQTKEKLEEYLKSYQNENGPLLVQEYIEQGKNPQYRADFFRDRNGKYKTAIAGKVTRWYPLDGGSGIFCTTIHDEEIISSGMRLLDAINWNGYANIDMVWDVKDNKAKVLEINGRTGASIKLDYVAGINISQQILENELGMEVTDYTAYEDGKSISCLLPDMLWFLKSSDRFRTKPSWFARKGVKDVIFSWDDPKPSLGFLIESVVSFRSSMQKRKRV